MRLLKSIIVFLLSLNCPAIFSNIKPKITLVLVADQLSINYIYKLEKFFSCGLKFLIDNGVFYKNAFYEHAPTTTAPGHATLSTGTFANYHGVINNKWYNAKNQKVKFEYDCSKESLVFSGKNKFYNFGISAKNLMADTLSDQLILNSCFYNNYQVWSLSLKPRAAVAMAGRLGKAVWFDKISGNFTSSKAYFNKFPNWIENFNNKHNIGKLKNFTWKSLNSDLKYYKFPYITNYKWAGAKSILDISNKIDFNLKEPFDLFYNTPNAAQLLIDLSKSCIDQFIVQNKNPENNNLVLYVSLSNLDKVGHIYGPYSKEAIDTVYFLDKQIGELLDYVYKKFNKKEVLVTLTADHGILPIPAILKEQGFNLVKVIKPLQIKENLNKKIELKFKVSNLITNFLDYQFYLDQSKLPKDSKSRKKIFNYIKQELKKIPGIRNAWTFEELSKVNFDKVYNLDIYIQRQLYYGRSGQIFYSIDPYAYIDDYGNSLGTSHMSPYNYDTHVPLIFYQKNQFENKSISKKVGIHQVAPTLAYILGMSRPSASKSEILPELI